MLLGIDIGTSKVAAVVIGGQKQLLASASLAHAAALPAGRSEQDADRLLQAVRRVVLKLPDDLRQQVKAIGVTGQMHGVVTVDEQLRPTGPLITWQDRRCDEAGFLESIRNKTGHVLRAGYGCATLAYLLQRRELPERTASCCTIHDFLAARLAGLSQPVTDPTDAASWGLFDLNNLQWDIAAARKIGIPPHLLPEIRPSSSLAGQLQPQAATDMGLPPGTPVAVALGDNQASLLATMKKPQEELALTLGTGGQLSAVVSELYPSAGDSPFECRPYLDGQWIVVAAALCGGAAWAWLVKSINHWLRDLGQRPLDESDLYAKIDELGLHANEPLSVRPNFAGERYDPALKGRIGGIGLDDFRIGPLACGLATGIVQNLKDMLPERARIGRRRVVGSGNALRKSALLRQMAEEVLGLPLSISPEMEEAAVGAAMNAASLR